MAFRAAWCLFLTILILLACGPKPEIPPAPPPAKGSPKAVLANLATTESKILTAAQSFDITISTNGRNRRKQSLDGTLFYKTGSYYFQIEATLGKDVTKVLIRNDSLWAYNPIDKTYLVDQSSSLIPDWGIGVKDVLNSIIGKYGLESGGTEYVGMVEGFYFYEIGIAKRTRKITVRPETENVTGIRLEPVGGGNQGGTVDVRFADFSNSGQAYRPRRITIMVREQELEMDIKINSERLNQELPDDLFELEIPTEAVRVSSERFWFLSDE